MIHEVAFGRSRKGLCLYCGLTFIVAQGEMLCVVCERPLIPIEPDPLGTLEAAEIREELEAWMELVGLSPKTDRNTD